MEICVGLLQIRGSKTCSSWINLTLLCSMLCMWSSVECWSYYYSNTTMNWQQARAWCQEHYTDMVAIQNQEEIGHLNNWLPWKQTYYWIGIRKINDVWTWVGTNKALTAEATNWAKGEPNNGKVLAIGTEDCVEMYIKRKEQTGKWNDERCQKNKTALCYTAACKNDSCHYGDCVETINSHKCVCFEGFYGDKCEHVVKCDSEEVTVPYMGSVNCTHKYGNFSYDSSCEYSCEKGYQLSMSRPLKCTASKTWSEQPPTCEPVQCPELSRPARGSMYCFNPQGPNSYQSLCVFACDKGYVQAGSPSNTLLCEASGSWNASQPSCVATPCQNPEGGAHLIRTCSESPNELRSGSNCSFSCEAGFELQGAHTIYCSENGQWSNTIPTCKAIGCPPPKIPTNGQISCSLSLSSPVFTGTPHPLGMFCTFSCDEGHELQGALSTECGYPGHWNTTPPTCTAVSCPLLEAPKNGDINCSNSEPVYNSQCYFTCSQDYSLDGHELLICDQHGNWTGKQPTCQASPSPISAVAYSMVTGGSLICGLSLAIWILKRLKRKTAYFEQNSASDIEAPLQVYKNRNDSLI